MPLIHVNLVEGRSPEKLRSLITEITEATERAIDAPKHTVRVIIQEYPADLWAAGDVTMTEQRKNSQ